MLKGDNEICNSLWSDNFRRVILIVTVGKLMV